MHLHIKVSQIISPNIIETETHYVDLNKFKHGGDLDIQKLLVGIELPGLKHKYPGENHVFQHSFTGQSLEA